MSGSLELIVGPMFAGKTRYLIERLLSSEGSGVLLVPEWSRRFPDQVQTHDGIIYPHFPIHSLFEACQLPLGEYQTIGIDEAQFFQPQELEFFCRYWKKDRGHDLVVAGLDNKYDKNPWESISHLRYKRGLCDKVTELKGQCIGCGSPSIYTYRKNSHKEIILLGGNDIYEPVCAQCWDLKNLLFEQSLSELFCFELPLQDHEFQD